MLGRLARTLAALLVLLTAVTVPVAAAGATEAEDEPTSEESAEESTAEDRADEIPVLDGVNRGYSDTMVRLYLAAFDRLPQLEGLAYWLDLYYRGVPLSEVARRFIVSPEGTSTFGGLSDDDFVTVLYDHVLGRAPDTEGGTYWRDRLAAGLPREDVLVSMSESAEFISDTGTVDTIAPPPSPFPTLPTPQHPGKRIVYGNSAQRVWLVDQGGVVIDSYLVSGKRQTPRPATYEVFSKSELAWAGHDGITMQWMVRYTYATESPYLPLGFHAIPRYEDGRPLQTEAQLGTYRSAGCTRQADHKAKALYDWAEIGTTVVVLP